MKEYNITVNFNDGTIESDFMELVENDYNSTKINFTFDIDERIVLKILYPDGTVAYVNDVINNEYVLQPGLLSQDGEYQMELAAYDGIGRLTNYQTMMFYVRPELVSTDEIVEPDDRVPILDSLINACEKLDADVNKVDDTATITITKKDGTTKSASVTDGKDFEYNWEGTSLGVRQEGESEYQYVDLKGDKGDPGSVHMIVVDTLPTENIDLDAIYLVPITPDVTGNNYAEYVYINNQWEQLGKIGVQVDLTNYVKNTDYASSNIGGTIRVSADYATYTSSGILRATSKTYAEYQNASNVMFIGKGTLENVITGKQLTDKNYVDTAISNAITTTLGGSF